MRDRSLPKQMIAKLWTEVKDHAEDEISAGARQQLKDLIEGRIEAEFEDLVRCGRYERSEERADFPPAGDPRHGPSARRSRLLSCVQDWPEC